MANTRSPRNVVSSLHPTRKQLDELDELLQRMLDLPVNRVEDRTGKPVPAAAASEETPAPVARPLQSGPRPEQPGAAEQIEPAARKPPAEPDQPEAKKAPPEEARTPAADVPSSSAIPPLAVQPPHRLRKRTPPSQPTAGPEEGEEGPDGEWVPFRSSWKPSPHTWPPLAESWAQAQKTPEQARLRRDEPVPTLDAAPPPAPARPAVPHAAEEPPSPLAKPFTIPERPVVGPPESDPEPVVPPLGLPTATETLIYPRPLFGSTLEPPEPRDPMLPRAHSEPDHFTEGRPRPDTSTPRPDADSTEELFWPLRQLIWINNVFDQVVGRAGAPGRWLAGPSGKTLLGVLGVVFLLGAVALFLLGWLGWT